MVMQERDKHRLTVMQGGVMVMQERDKHRLTVRNMAQWPSHSHADGAVPRELAMAVTTQS